MHGECGELAVIFDILQVGTTVSGSTISLRKLTTATPATALRVGGRVGEGVSSPLPYCHLIPDTTQAT